MSIDARVPNGCGHIGTNFGSAPNRNLVRLTLTFGLLQPTFDTHLT